MKKQINKNSSLAVLDIIDWEKICQMTRINKVPFFYPPNSKYSNIYPITKLSFDNTTNGLNRLAHLLMLAQENLKEKYDSIPILLAMPSIDRTGLIPQKNNYYALFDEIEKIMGFSNKFVRNEIICFYQGRTSFAYQLQKAHEILINTEHDKIMIISIDSFLFPETLYTVLENHLLDKDDYWKDDYWDKIPLDKNYLLSLLTSSLHQIKAKASEIILASDNKKSIIDGFISTEAAGAVVVGLSKDYPTSVQIDGIGFGEESSFLLSEEKCECKGMGLAEAISNACKSAGKSFCDYPVRIASISGEDYFFQESNLAQEKIFSESNKIDQPLWYPASCIGEIGAVVGIAMLAMAIDSFQKGYALGDSALCHLSSDKKDRAAFSVIYKTK